MSDAAALVVDAAIVFVLIEVAVLVVLWRRGTGLPPRAFLADLGAGLLLMLALRAAVADAPWPWIAAALAAAGACHAADLAARLAERRRGR